MVLERAADVYFANTGITQTSLDLVEQEIGSWLSKEIAHGETSLFVILPNERFWGRLESHATI